jgi:hypothetical protein
MVSEDAKLQPNDEDITEITEIRIVRTLKIKPLFMQYLYRQYSTRMAVSLDSNRAPT